MTDYTGTPIPTDQAWRTFSDWKGNGREIGVIFYGGAGTSLYTMGFIESARNGRLPVLGFSSGVKLALGRPKRRLPEKKHQGLAL